MKFTTAITMVSLMSLSQATWATVDVQSLDQSQSFGYETLEDIHLKDSYIPDFNRWILTLGYSFSDRPLILENSSSTQSISNVINNYQIGNFGGAYRFTDYLSVGVTSGIVYTNWASTIPNPGNNTGFEDTELRLKWTFLHGDHWGLGIQPYLTFATGTSSDYLSNNGTGTGALLTWVQEFPSFSYILSGGFAYNYSAYDNTYGTLNYQQMVLTEAGLYYRLFDRLALMAEFKREFSVALGGSVVNPNNLFFGARYAITNSLGAFGGMAFGNPLQQNDANDYRFMVGLKYSPNDKPKPQPAPAQPAPPENRLVKCEQKDITPEPVIYTVRFRHNEAVSISTDTLAQIKSSVKQLGVKFNRVLVVGHTSLVGKPAYNKALSYRRAESIKTILIESGLKKHDVWSEGRGLEEPIVSPEKSEADQALNRRVEIRVEYKPEWKQICAEEKRK